MERTYLVVASRSPITYSILKVLFIVFIDLYILFGISELVLYKCNKTMLYKDRS